MHGPDFSLTTCSNFTAGLPALVGPGLAVHDNCEISGHSLPYRTQGTRHAYYHVVTQTETQSENQEQNFAKTFPRFDENRNFRCLSNSQYFSETAKIAFADKKTFR